MNWLQAQYWSCLARLAWKRIDKLKNEACYECSHHKTGRVHHLVWMLSDAELIERFLEVARGTIRCDDVMLAWRREVTPFTPSERKKFDAPWFMSMYQNVPRSLRMFRRLIVEGDVYNLMEVEGDGVTDEGMLEATGDAYDDGELSDDTLLRAAIEADTEMEVV